MKQQKRHIEDRVEEPVSALIDLPSEWAEGHRFQAEHIARRFGLPPLRADLIASLAFGETRS